ncbi:S66 peptidase family protein [Actinoplanes sp. CA-142083]|uniref:S66 peptidase family protein n=1 Tax=Actinoplanes sp. CA-142083 TaxID=3239903 RepID=UPI003D91FFD1
MERLRVGDLVALIAPSGAIGAGEVAAAIRVVEGWGLKARVGRHALGRHSFHSGTDAERLADLNEALRDPEARGILCLRGGYGLQRIVDDVDFGAARADPKPVMGYSDITALHLALWCQAGIPSVHGPTAGHLSRGAGEARRALMSGEPIEVAADPAESTFPVRVDGVAEGVLVGGNLTILAATAGTRHQPDLRGAILLIEDVNEAPYRIDRSLVQLRRAGWLDGLAGVAIGQFTRCVDESYPRTAEEVLAEHLGGRIPVLGGLPIGHGVRQTAVGLGVRAVLDAGAGTLVVAPIAGGR